MAAKPRTYCVPGMVLPPANVTWVDALTGAVAHFRNGCLEAPDGMPKVLLKAQGMAARD